MKGRTLIRIVFLLYIAAVFYLCFGNFSSLSGAPRHIWGLDSDKVVHFLMFFPFPILCYFSFRWPGAKVWHSVLFTLCILGIGCAVAAGTELIQGYLPYRSADRADFGADFLALCISTVITLIVALNKTLRHA